MINAINLVDGVDGLSSGLSIIILSSLSWMFFISQDFPRAALGCTLIGGLIPFFVFNVFGNKSKMFIGDAGTLMLGIVFCDMVMAMLTDGSLCERRVMCQKASLEAFAFAVMTVPVFDTLRVMFGRIMRGRSPFRPDRSHLHHAFIEYGFHHLETALLEIFLTLMVIVLWFVLSHSFLPVEFQLCGVIVAGLAITFGLYWMLGRKKRIAKRREKLGLPPLEEDSQ